MAQRLAGKIAIVTGAASGIGRAICQRYANEGAGVMLVDRNLGRLEKVRKSLNTDFGNKHFITEGSVGQIEFTSKVFDQVKENYGKCGNVLVNCAGITRDTLLINMTEKQFDDVIQINLKGIFTMTKSFIGTLRQTGGMASASIINISSIVGKVGNAGQANYAASKAGAIGFTKSTGIEMGRYGIRCNAVLPGFIKTPMTDTVPEDIMKKYLKLIPQKRLGTPEEVANVCLFLASDESSYVNCATLEVTGGFMA
uniref:(3R)-3-hydroxyacyl-CoA dehydrogenase n=1 Tax=Ciona savignyi TaxID=51511 RepID=H2ZDE9_CIOSA